jgi:asparagine synthase (glutamine-hydrolysing)
LLDCEELTRLLAESVKRNHADALLLSGGLDSSILASLVRPQYSVTVGFGDSAPDLAYARQVAQKYSKHHIELVFDHSRMADLVEKTIRALQTFDTIEVRNSVVALAGIEQAKADGYGSVMTGDGSDELFAGYNYLSRYYSDIAKLESELRRLWRVMHFSSKKLGEYAGVRVKTPFLDDEFASFSKSISVSNKIGKHHDKMWGKFILRKCFELSLGPLVWRPKVAQEKGASTDSYQKFIEEQVDDLTFINKRRIALEGEGVMIRSKEHLHYYAIFRSYFPPPRELEESCNSAGKFVCPECQGRIIAFDARFCRICGAFPIVPLSP